ncbi:VOC family protein [uncultured Schumannella sp.]|jgi:uncharacterized protein|uniref:VOC family protein n=1 Tax=uncultured Schumannella sp. TaxID=1195956 RepID=UPI0025F53F9A|nr:VOC family protein [uncultured Schumannella sp.]
MARMFFPNLAVRDLTAAIAFYSALGFENHAGFTDESAAAMVVSDEVVIMLLSPAFAAENGMAPPSGTAATSHALQVESRAEVDAFMTRALSAGASPLGEPQELGFMYARGMTDPDGHIWHAHWMDPAALP